MKAPEEVVELFRKKYVHLQTVYPSVGAFNEYDIRQNPDGGWQLDLLPCAAITIRAGDDEAHEVHGGICARWRQEGGAFDETCKLGWIGAPISDEEAFLGLGDFNDRISHFERGDIIWIAKNNETRIVNVIISNQELMEIYQKLHEKVIGIIADILGVDKNEISSTSDFWDHDVAEIAIALEDEFGMPIPEAVFHEYPGKPFTFNDLCSSYSYVSGYCQGTVGEIEHYLLGRICGSSRGTYAKRNAI